MMDQVPPFHVLVVAGMVTELISSGIKAGKYYQLTDHQL